MQNLPTLILGDITAFTITSSNLEKSLAYYQKTVGLHQTKNFDYPALTFFAADMKEKITGLTEGGLTDYVEKGSANIVLTNP